MSKPTQAHADMMAAIQQMLQRQRKEDKEEREERERQRKEEKKELRKEEREEREKQRQEDKLALQEECLASYEENKKEIAERYEVHRKELKEMSDEVRAWLNTANKKQQQMAATLQTQGEIVSTLRQETEENIRLVKKDIEEIDQVVTEQARNLKAHKRQGEEKDQHLHEQIKQLEGQIAQTKAEKVTYIYKNAEDMPKLRKFHGEGNDNPIEFLIDCEKNMETVGGHLTDNERIEWIVRRLEGSATKWYSIIREGVSEYSDFKNKFEARYWNDSLQHKVRDQLEFGRYGSASKTKELYVIDLVAKAKHLRPKLTESEMVNKLSYHFHRDITVAVLTRGIKTIEEFLLMLAQWEEIRYPQRPTPLIDNQAKPNQSGNYGYSNKPPQQSYPRKPYVEPQKKLQALKYPSREWIGHDTNNEKEGLIASTSRLKIEKGNIKSQ